MRRAVALGVLLAVATLAVTTLAAGPEDKPKGKKSAAAGLPTPRAVHVIDGGLPADGGTASLTGARPVRVRLLDGSTVSGTVHAEEAQALVIDCSFGLLAIPRARISTIAYDSAAEIGQKHAPVQMLDDDGPPPKKQTATP